MISIQPKSPNELFGHSKFSTITHSVPGKIPTKKDLRMSHSIEDTKDSYMRMIKKR